MSPNDSLSTPLFPLDPPSLSSPLYLSFIPRNRVASSQPGSHLVTRLSPSRILRVFSDQLSHPDNASSAFIPYAAASSQPLRSFRLQVRR